MTHRPTDRGKKWSGLSSAGSIRWLFFLVPSLAVLFVYFGWPGDVPWINDEPIFLAKALNANATGRLAMRGLMGHLGTPYGPFAVWVYQALLLMTHDLIIVAVLKIALTFAVVFLSLHELARELSLPKHPMLMALASPFLVFYARLLWDNCFLIPLSALLMMSAVKFIYHKKVHWLYLGIVSAVCMFYLHLMSALIIVPTAACLIVFNRKWFMAHWRQTIVACLFLIAISAPYATVLLSGSQWTGVSASRISNAAFNNIEAIQFFSFWEFDRYFFPELLSSAFFLPQPVYVGLKTASGLSYLFFLLGAVLSVKTIVQRIVKKKPLSDLEKCLVYFLFVIVFSFLFFRITRIDLHPHYSNGICLSYFMIMWYGIGRFWEKRWMAAAYAVYAVSQLVLIVSFLTFVHLSGGNRGIHYGATLGNQIAIVRQIDQYNPKSPIVVDVQNIKYFPHAMDVLLRFYHPPKDESGDKPYRRLRITYAKDDRSGWIELDALD